MNNTPNICEECGVNIALSSIHLPFCSQSTAEVAQVEPGSTDEAVLKFSASLVSTVNERVINILRAGSASLPEDERLDDDELDVLIEEAKTTSTIATMTVLHVLMEQELIDEEKMRSMIDLYAIDWDDFQ